jgi:hypothetical protein
MPVCQYCKAQLVTEGIYCDDCSLEVVFDTLEGDVIVAYQEGIITNEECRFVLGSTTTPVTEADEERFYQIIRKVDGYK